MKKELKVAVIGAGNCGCATAADMAYRGLDVTLIKTSKTMREDNFKWLLENDNCMELIDFGEDGCMTPTGENAIAKIGHINLVTREISEISNADIIIITVQTTYHEQLIKNISSYIKDGQIVLVIPGYFSTAFFLKYCKKDIIVAEAQSSFIDCRIGEVGKIKVGFRNVRNPIGIYPSSKFEEAKAKLELLGFPFHYMRNTLSAAIHNPNLIVHTVGAIMSIPMIDTLKDEFCMYHRAFTEHVWKILEKLDSEKMDVLERLGASRLPYVEACKFRNTLDESVDAKGVFFEYASMPTRAKSPTQVDSRYISEDVPEGLCLLESLGEILGVKTPICTALIEIASAALDRDLRATGRNVERLGKDNIEKIIDDGKY